MKQRQEPCISAETFDDFLVEQGVLKSCEDQAIQEMASDQLADTNIENGAIPKA